MYMDMHVQAGPWSNHIYIPQGAIVSDNRKLGSHDLFNFAKKENLNLYVLNSHTAHVEQNFHQLKFSSSKSTCT